MARATGSRQADQRAASEVIAMTKSPGYQSLRVSERRWFRGSHDPIQARLVPVCGSGLRFSEPLEGGARIIRSGSYNFSGNLHGN